MARPYILGGVGAYHVKVDAAGNIVSETKFAFGLGGGGSGGMGQSHFFVEGRFVSIRESGGSASFLPLSAGGTLGAEYFKRDGGGGGGGVGVHSPAPQHRP